MVATTGWYWAQGVNTTGRHRADISSGGPPSLHVPPLGMPASLQSVQAAFVLAGGRLPSPLVPENWLPDLWLLGVRTPNRRCEGSASMAAGQGTNTGDATLRVWLLLN